MSPTDSPWRANRRGTAKTGPMPISSGPQPAEAKPRKVPSGVSPRRAASAPDITTQADAPSDSWLALPAVTNAPSPRTGLSLARPSSVVSGRLPSSFARRVSTVRVSPVALSVTDIIAEIGTISSSNSPRSWAAAVRRWLSSENASWASREMP